MVVPCDYIASKSEKDSTSSQSFSDAMNNMLNEDGMPSFMKKIMEREKRAPKAERGSESIASPEEVDTFGKEEEELIHRCDEAMKELETGIEKKTLPFFVRPMAKQLITNLKSIRSKAESRLSELRSARPKPNASETQPEVNTVKTGASEAGGAKPETNKTSAESSKSDKTSNTVSEATKKATETGKASEAKTDPKSGSASEKPKSGSSKPEDVMSEFMKTLKKNFGGDNNVCSLV